MKRSSFFKKINSIIIFIICIAFNACNEEKNEINLSKDDLLLLNDIVKSTEINFTKKKNVFELEISGTKLNTVFGKEMGASISTLIIYDYVVNNYTMLDYNTNFNISYLDDHTSYKYNLKEVSDALNGQIIIDELLNDLKKIDSTKIITENHKKLINQKLDISENTLVNFGGFGFDKLNSNFIFFRVIFYNEKLEMRVYWDKINNKILKTEWYNIR